MENRATTKQRAPKYRRLTVEVREDVALRLDRSVRLYSRYGTPGDVVAECVHLYLSLLEIVDKATEMVKKSVIRCELKRRTKLLRYIVEILSQESSTYLADKFLSPHGFCNSMPCHEAPPTPLLLRRNSCGVQHSAAVRH